MKVPRTIEYDMFSEQDVCRNSNSTQIYHHKILISQKRGTGTFKVLFICNTNTERSLISASEVMLQVKSRIPVRGNFRITWYYSLMNIHKFALKKWARFCHMVLPPDASNPTMHQRHVFSRCEYPQIYPCNAKTMMFLPHQQKNPSLIECQWQNIYYTF